ncbi:MAG: thiamine pyrophosphate-dependent dehydrogenase E1 component subunit alpha [Sphaerochaeta sp.]|uniref:thiamine pyrophosphate-dependent dehydrogenase E1 component subunit alpha n=1 Tax=Sphaerochaeta associata TaxID=1129264 RepID=UPI002B216EE0|nr:thiamine pyrophosphate-dependent dehydrogenase E1 component subunit alpha [Sphaerochaeta associata]MEA5030499.1 thiamine pyrophosphate-dependent dehydrogenase E1 component subunit alpha [Sphaerochaeta associata]MEA5031417.1 thiamine pyrophosphate-dependent dehydrogenase E1 component subunit alpha [Sphaerochaeta sp.]
MKFVKEKLDNQQQLYFQLLRSRMLQERIQELQKQKVIKTHLYLELGEEAITVGCDAALQDGDLLAAYWRGDSTCLVRRGMDLKSLMAWWLGKKDTSVPVRMMLPTSYGDVKMGLIPRCDSCLGSEMDVTAGVALSLKYAGVKNIAAVMIGEGATNRSNFHESMTFAALQKLPVVYICRTNGWAMSTPTHRTIPVESVTQIGAAYGIRTIEVDGNDIERVIEVLKDAFSHARGGNGPVLVNALTYRMGPHSANDEDDYRPQGEKEAWKKKDPIVRLKKRMLENRVPEDVIERIQLECATTIGEAEKYAYELQDQEASEVIDIQAARLKIMYGGELI